MRKLFLLIILSLLAGCSVDNASNDNNNALFDTWLYTRTLDVTNGEVVNIYIPVSCGLNDNFTFSSNGTYTQYEDCSGELKEGTWVYKGNNIYEFIETTDGIYYPWGA